MYSKCTYGGNCTGYAKVKRYSEHALQSAVANVGPVAVGIDASHITFQLYLGGVYHNPFCSKFLVNHAAVVTGYGALRSGSYWLVKNSWGPKWGYGGYVLMARYRSNNCGIATEASYPTTS
ncbi:cathepsin [Plakobranchus ocellatus]|uniref:Cathepsin n=1 Tax=Plakobranchus ocellatus TaxID=259542 RepID=A0AAV4CZ80_9GAST|nr:cathepsin [Plakobranchus ocellatus]